MFSGIVETLGIILRIENAAGCKHFTIAPAIPFNDLHIGDSVSVNGVCLTVIEIKETHFKVTAVPETLRITNLDKLIQGDKINLERAIKVNARIGGHHVQGHIDCLGKIIDLRNDHGDALIATIALPVHLTKYIVAKGFITIDGMSITVIDATLDSFTVTLIPHTQNVTLAQYYQVSTEVNIEVDMMGKYIEKLLGAYSHANIN